MQSYSEFTNAGRVPVQPFIAPAVWL